jgi:nitrogen regulatory protein PII
MKRVDIYVPYNNVSEVTMVLHKHDIGGMTLSDVRGRGKISHKAIPEVVSGEWHMTGKRIVPEYVQRSYISAIMQESQIKRLIDDLRKINVERGKVFVSDVTEAYDLSSGEEGEKAL